jgi:hypothetical protein
MVKNAKGGKGAKSLARKMVSGGETSEKRFVRKPESELEQFALTTKMYGTMCEVTTCDGKSYKCVIRGKFSGRKKRQCLVSPGKILLVGFRDFEAPNFKVCDLLEVYEQSEVNQLQKTPGVNIQSLIAQMSSYPGESRMDDTMEDLFDFSESGVSKEDREAIIAENKFINPSDTSAEGVEELISIDDI